MRTINTPCCASKTKKKKKETSRTNYLYLSRLFRRAVVENDIRLPRKIFKRDDIIIIVGKFIVKKKRKGSKFYFERTSIPTENRARATQRRDNFVYLCPTMGGRARLLKNCQPRDRRARIVARNIIAIASRKISWMNTRAFVQLEGRWLA